MLLAPMIFFSSGSITTEQMCIIFAACFILRGRDTYIDFLQFITGRHDFPFDASPKHFIYIYIYAQYFFTNFASY